MCCEPAVRYAKVNSITDRGQLLQPPGERRVPEQPRNAKSQSPRLYDGLITGTHGRFCPQRDSWLHLVPIFNHRMVPLACLLSDCNVALSVPKQRITKTGRFTAPEALHQASPRDNGPSIYRLLNLLVGQLM